MNVVAPVKGTVAAPPESACSSKLPSGEEMVQESTPLVFQKTEVRVPSGTLAGTAQISTSGVIADTVEVEDTGGGVFDRTCWTTTGEGGGVGVPT